MLYELKFVSGHVEVYNKQGMFLFSADSQQEALEEMRAFEAA